MMANKWFVPELIKYSKNEIDPVYKQLMEEIETLYFNMRQCWWNSNYMEDPRQRDETRTLLKIHCEHLAELQEFLKSYREYYKARAEERLPIFKEIETKYYELLKGQGLMI